jgi:hypothetical protein
LFDKIYQWLTKFILDRLFANFFDIAKFIYSKYPFFDKRHFENCFGDKNQRKRNSKIGKESLLFCLPSIFERSFLILKTRMGYTNDADELA